MENKTFINRVAKVSGRDPRQVSSLIETMANTLKNYAADLDSVAVPGFGVFQPVKRPESLIEKPDGSRTLIPPSVNLTFKESVILRKKL